MDKIIYFLKVIIITIIISPLAMIFLILSIFNYDLFWEKYWCNFIRLLERTLF